MGILDEGTELLGLLDDGKELLGEELLGVAEDGRELLGRLEDGQEVGALGSAITILPLCPLIDPDPADPPPAPHAVDE